MRLQKLVFVVVGLCISAQASALVGLNARGIYTTKTLDKSAWGDLHNQSAYGIAADWDIALFPIDITAAIYWLNSSLDKDGEKTELSSREVHLGIIKGFALIDLIRPYFGLGVVNSSNELERKKSGTKETTTHDANGYWGAVGLQINFGGFQAALDIRQSYIDGSKEFEDNESLGGAYQSFSLGFNF